MKSGRDHSTQRADANDEVSLFAGHVVLTTYHPDSAPHWKEAAAPPAPPSRPDDIPPSYGRYCDQPMGWGARVFGLAGTAPMIGLVFAIALFTWQAVYQPVHVTSQPLTVVELQPLAALPEPVRNVPPGPEQVEKQEAELEPVTEPLPLPLVQPPMPNVSARDTREPVTIIDPGPAAPDTTAPKSIVAPIANRLTDDARSTWESLILAHLERFRRYPARARAARQQGTVYVRFRVNRAGVVLSSAIVKKSGTYDLDQAALDTLQRAQPLPAIPTYMADEVELSVPVEYYLAR